MYLGFCFGFFCLVLGLFLLGFFCLVFFGGGSVGFFVGFWFDFVCFGGCF